MESDGGVGRCVLLNGSSGILGRVDSSVLLNGNVGSGVLFGGCSGIGLNDSGGVLRRINCAIL